MHTETGQTWNGLNVDDRDWSALSEGERIRQIELEGYLIVPGILSPEHLETLRAETDKLPTEGRDYSERQRGCSQIHLRSRILAELVAHRPTLDLLERLFGDRILCLHNVTYDRSEPGTPGISLHTDGQPYGSSIFGYEGSCPVTVRVLYYLDDLTMDVSPFRVIPRSHVCMHADAHPYKRYTTHPEQVVVPCRAGSALFLNHRTFHGTLPNTGTRPRRMIAIAYRPAWAGPIAEVPMVTDEDLAKLPASVRPYFSDSNAREFDFAVGNKPEGMSAEAPGMAPSRWSRA